MAAVLSIRRVTSSSASPALLDEIHRLLLAVFVDDFTDDDWDHCCGGWHVLVVDGPAVVAHAAVGARWLEVDSRPVSTGYVEGVAVDAARQSEGIGSLLMDDVGDVIRSGYEMGGLSTDRHSFYERVGWERWGGETYVRRATGLERSEDEDDGVMVLRFGPSVNVDLTLPMSCSERSGDDW